MLFKQYSYIIQRLFYRTKAGGNIEKLVKDSTLQVLTCRQFTNLALNRQFQYRHHINMRDAPASGTSFVKD